MTVRELYPFQARGLDAGRAAFRAGARAVLFVAPTGAGKTTIASAAISGVVARGGRVAVFAHRRELVSQMTARLRADGLEVGADGLASSARVQVTSVQTVLARGELPDANFVVFDEAHHYVSDEWIRVPRAYASKGAKMIGLTATPARDDGRGLGGEDGVFDSLVVVAQIAELVSLNATIPHQGITPIEVHAPADNVRALALAPVDAYEAHAAGRCAVVFAPNVKNAEVFAEAFAVRAIPSAIVHGAMATAERDAALARFAAGEIRVLVNVAVLTEGWDAPICDVCILARKIGSPALYMQCVGRARRPDPRRGAALLLDLAGNVEIHGHPDEDRVFSLEGDAISRKNGALPPGPRICRVCRRDLSADLEAEPDLVACPECHTVISRIRVLTPEEVELQRVERDEARARAGEDTKTKALRSLYIKGLRASHKRAAAEFAFRSMFRHYPPTAMRAVAWREATDLVAQERGDAWEVTT